MFNIYKGKIGRLHYLFSSMILLILFLAIYFTGGAILLSIFGPNTLDDHPKITYAYIIIAFLFYAIWQHSLTIRRMRDMGETRRIFLLDILPFGAFIRYFILLAKGRKKKKARKR